MSTLVDRRRSYMKEFYKVPQEVWDDLEYQIKTQLADEPCVDNRRAFRYKDGLHESDFIKADKSGCCGFFRSHTIVDGDKWIIGCNYGH